MGWFLLISSASLKSLLKGPSLDTKEIVEKDAGSLGPEKVFFGMSAWVSCLS